MAPKVAETQDLEDVVDSETGEVEGPIPVNQLASIVGLKSKEILAIMRKGAEAKAEDFEERELDFWKPREVEPGQPPDELRGVYLGVTTVGGGKNAGGEKVEKRRQHAFGVESKKHPGKGHVIRMNGSAALNAILANFAQGDFLLVRYLGKKGTVDGFQAKMWDVKKLRVE